MSGKKRQGKKTVVVEIRYPDSGMKWASDWHKFKAYETQEIAQQVVNDKKRGTRHLGVQYRIKPTP